MPLNAITLPKAMTRGDAVAGAARRDRALRRNLEFRTGYMAVRERLISLVRETAQICGCNDGYVGEAPRTPDELLAKTAKYVAELHARLLETTDTRMDKGALHERFLAWVAELCGEVRE